MDYCISHDPTNTTENSLNISSKRYLKYGYNSISDEKGKITQGILRQPRNEAIIRPRLEELVELELS